MREWMSLLTPNEAIEKILNQYELHKEHWLQLPKQPVAVQGEAIMGRYLSLFLQSEIQALGQDQCFALDYNTLDRIPIALSAYVRETMPSKEEISKTLACIFYALAITEHGCSLHTVRAKGQAPAWEGDLSLKLGKKRELDFLPAAIKALSALPASDNHLIIYSDAISEAYYSALGVNLIEKGLVNIAIELSNTIAESTDGRENEEYRPTTLEESMRLAPYGNIYAMTNLAISYFKRINGLKQDYRKAKLWFDRLAERNDRDAIFNIGLMYERGLGVPRNLAKAEEYISRAAEAGDNDALNLTEIIRSILERKTVAESGDINAQTDIAESYISLGICISDGDSAIDYQDGIRWAKKAAEGGSAKAMWMLGLCYEKGRGVAVNKAAAVQWYRRGAELGFPQAQTNLGLMYGRGDGVKRDETIAKAWIKRGAEGGDRNALEMLKKL